MTYEETKEWLLNLRNCKICGNNGLTDKEATLKHQQYCDKALEAVEKQEPVKPIIDDETHVTPWYFCGSCGELITEGYHECENDYRFCSSCGQAIDWSES